MICHRAKFDKLKTQLKIEKKLIKEQFCLKDYNCQKKKNLKKLVDQNC